MTIISNTTVLSNFASIGALDLLRQLYQTLAIPVDVYEEIEVGLREGYKFYEGIPQLIFPIAEPGWLQMTSLHEEELRLFSELSSRLHSGERACLAIASKRGWWLLTDDRAARREASRRNIRVSGTIGCLVLAVEREIYSLMQANEALTAMIQKGYLSPVTDLTALLKPEK
jgi:predicted nucleic acid-binding protein